MDIEQMTNITVMKDGKPVILVVKPDMPLGLLFDALMEMKGYVVERMMNAHKEEEQEAEKQIGDEKEEE